MTVILPCAGEGNRLGLKTPKELFEILPGKRLIDFSLEHILAWDREREKGILRLQIAVVIRSWKKEVAEYVAVKLPGIRVETVLFDDNYTEWPGSVYSAAAFFSPYNLVLLPDSYLCLRDCGSYSPDICFNVDGKTLVELTRDALDKYKVIFGAVPCTDPNMLKHLGAMKVEQGKVTAFQDKPLQNSAHFNSFWGCYGFRIEYGKELYDFLIRSVHHQPVSLEEQSFYPPGSIPLYSYLDLGTWDN
ncbi:MAG TPA: hypothetical protein VK186_27735, partial [Candidatus Deferrimicrobium sp.]|nr:hypothetical protein [Candidatus Deferrimicrobium sp.]